MFMTIATARLLAPTPFRGYLAANLLILVLLLILSWIDVRTRYVPPTGVLTIGLLAIPGISFPDACLSIGVYALLRLASASTEQSIGGGDIKLLAALALYLGYYEFSLFVLPLGIGCLAVIAWALIKKAPKNQQIPFVPFISGSFICWILLFFLKG